MNEINTLFLNIAHLSELLSAILGTVYFYKYKDGPLKWLMPYLWFVVIVEYFGTVIMNKGENNGWLYNILTVVELTVVAKMYYDSFQTVIWCRWVIVCYVISMVCFGIDALLISDHGVMHLLNYGTSIIDLVICVICLMAIYELVNSEKVLNLSQVLLFWVSCGFLVFHLCTVPITVISNIFKEISPNSKGLLNFQLGFCVLMYLCFSVGFIKSKKDS